MNKLFGIFFLTLFSLSCSSELDFDQANEIKAEPVLVANVASFNIKANDLIVNGIELPLIGDTVDFDVFNDPSFLKTIQRADFFLELDNTINRAFAINMTFLNASGANLYSILVDVPSYSGKPNVISINDVFESTKLEMLKQTKEIAFNIVLVPGTPLTNSSLGRIKLRSSCTIYFNIK